MVFTWLVRAWHHPPLELVGFHTPPGCDIMISHSSGTWETRPASGGSPNYVHHGRPLVPFGWSVLGRPNYMLSFAVKSAEMEVVPAGWKTTFFLGGGLDLGLQEKFRRFILTLQMVKTWPIGNFLKEVMISILIFLEEKGSKFCHWCVCQEDSGVTTARGQVYWKVWRWFMNQTFWIFLDTGSIFLDEFARVYTSNFSPLESLNHL